jgi:hypothetical protein
VVGHYRLLDDGGWGGLGQPVAVDLNGDGILDLLASNWGAVNYFLTEDGGYGIPSFVDFPGPYLGGILASGDLDSDGRQDVIAVGSIYLDGTVGFVVLLNTCGH